MGAPVGNKNAVRAKMWKAAIERALSKRSVREQKEAIDEIAEALIDRCIDGDMTAIKEFGDRMDGKVPQAIIGDEENPVHMVSKIERVIIDRTASRDP